MAQRQQSTISNMKQMIFLQLVATSIALAIISNKQTEAISLGPLVQTGVSNISPEGRHVSVNVPGIYNLNLDTRGEHNGARMEQTVLSGLVRINMDRQRGADGRLHGPLKVTVGGLTMYDSGEEATV